MKTKANARLPDRMTVEGMRALLDGYRWSDFKDYKRVWKCLGGQLCFEAFSGYHMQRPAIWVEANGKYVVLKYIDLAGYRLAEWRTLHARGVLQPPDWIGAAHKRPLDQRALAMIYDLHSDHLVLGMEDSFFDKTKTDGPHNKQGPSDV